MKDRDYAEFTFHVAIDENGNVRGDEDAEGARERLNDDADGNAMDIYTVTVQVPYAKVREVNLGKIAVAEDGASIAVESVEAA
jgi:hypothetical protein